MLLCAVSGCSDSLGPEDVTAQPEASLQTSALSYTLQDNGSDYHIIVPTSYVNRSAGIVYEGWCSRILEKRVGKLWVTANAIPCPLIGTSPKAYSPGVTYQIDFSVLGAYVPNTYPRFELTPIPGIYRFRIDLYATATPAAGGLSTLTDLLPINSRVTNEFWLALPK